SELLSPARIRVPLRAGDKEGVLRELVEMVGNGGGGLLDEVLGAILERERQFPTGIGYGVAVPHGKTPALAALVVVAGTTPAPVPYETIDGEPVRLFFLLAGPESAAGSCSSISATAPVSYRSPSAPARRKTSAASRAAWPARRSSKWKAKSSRARRTCGTPSSRPARSRSTRRSSSSSVRPSRPPFPSPAPKARSF